MKVSRSMTVWAISDLHLSFAKPERQARLPARWSEHVRQIEQNWRAVVADSDVVLIPGDISLARNHRDVQPDLAWLERLPGLKVLSAGNHDDWWNSVDRVRPMLRKSMRAVEGDAVAINGVIVCGARGAAIERDDSSPAERGAMRSQIEGLRRALAAARALGAGGEPVFALWHYPPFDAGRQPGPVVALLEEAGVAGCVYGHLHAESQWALAVQGVVNGVRYHCVAADAIGFRPLRVG